MTSDSTSLPGSVESFGLSTSKSVLLDKSSVNHARVDFSQFRPLKAKIDCIVFACWLADFKTDSLKKIEAGIRDGHLVVPTDRIKWGVRERPYLTVHDPSLRDLQYLVERFWDNQTIKIEFAVDARLPPGSNDLHLLEQLKGQLRHCLYPQAHDRIPKAKRKYFNLGIKKYRDDGLGTTLPDGQIIWEQTSVDDKLALYIKTKDNFDVIGQPWVRMEARLEGSALTKAGLGRVGMLPHFAANLRTYLSPMFSVACGFKNVDELGKHPGVSSDPWSVWGAQWTGKGKIKAKLKNDADAIKHIGAALGELRSSLMHLKPPTVVAHRYDEWIDDMTY